MEQVTIMSDNPRMSLREYKELINEVLGHEKRPSGMRRNVDMVDNLSIDDLPW
jgi:hypothetical protein